MTARAIRRDLPTRPSSLFSGNRLAVVLLGRRDAPVLLPLWRRGLLFRAQASLWAPEKRRDPWAAGSRELAGPSEDEGDGVVIGAARLGSKSNRPHHRSVVTHHRLENN